MTATTMSTALADMTEAGAFGPGSRFVSFEPNGLHTGQDQIASTVLYGTLTVSDQGVRRDHLLVLKSKHRMAELREMYDNDKQFQNEMLFYERIVPMLLDCAMTGDDPLDCVPPLCHYFYGRNDCRDLVLKDIIVLEDAAAVQGYRMSDGQLHLDFDHLVVALRTLAKFHGLSYKAKHADPIGFAETVAGIVETQFRDDGEWTIGGIAGLAGLFSAALVRLAGRSGECEPVRRFRCELLGDDDGATTMRRVMRPTEPMAVLCHGDFNRNKLLFRYDADGDRPVEAMPFDMAAVRYGSPALDLSLLLYTNAGRATRDRHWDALLDEYCAALSAAVSDESVSVPNRARLDAEMRDHAFYGLVRASYLLRALTDERKRFDPAMFVYFDDETLRSLTSMGGDRTTGVIADAVQHFIDHVLADDAARSL